jgi:hypothetical protein
VTGAAAGILGIKLAPGCALDVGAVERFGVFLSLPLRSSFGHTPNHDNQREYAQPDCSHYKPGVHPLPRFRTRGPTFHPLIIPDLLVL